MNMKAVRNFFSPDADSDDELVHIALFKETEVDSAAEAVAKLRTLGVADKDISVISGIPFSEKILGRPVTWTRIPAIGISGAVVGIIASLALNLGTPLLYPVRVGGMAYLPIPPTIVLTFELGMLGLMISVFLGVLIETMAPSSGPRGYHPKISEGYIGVLFTCHPGKAGAVISAVKELGAEMVNRSEVKNDD